MNDYEHIYQKLRKDFGKHCNFEDTDPKMLGTIEMNTEYYEQYVTKNPVDLRLDNIPDMGEHSVNTKRIPIQSRGQLHVEGGWPKEIDYSENQDTAKWRKRLDKDPAFTTAVRSLCQDVTHFLLQNSTIDMFEDYFAGENASHQQTTMSTNTVAVFKDPVSETDTRHVTRISWHPEGPHRFVASYSILRFQRMDDSLPRMSFIWDVENPNQPAAELNAVSPLVSLAYQPKNVDLIAGGCYNGLIMLYDLRSGGGGSRPVLKTNFQNSHYDPVYDLVWLQSKTQSECVTVSSDAQVLWWDVRNLEEPTDRCELTNGDKENPKSMGGTSLEWSQEAGPTKYLVGTEQGCVLALNKKPKKAVETSMWFGLESKGGISPHYGPVYKVHRNPAHCKNFLTIGDWCAKIWLEELKSPVMQTAPAPAYLTCGGWSPTRPGVFYTCRQDGFIDFYDYFYRMNEVAYCHKVSDASILSSALQNHGRLLAVGDSTGTVNLLELCDELWQTPVGKGAGETISEKVVVGNTFDREMRREKNLDAIKKAANRGGGAGEAEADASQMRGVDEAKYITREKAWHKELGIVAEEKDFTIAFDNH
jgi:dynein intermediate chain 2